MTLSATDLDMGLRDRRSTPRSSARARSCSRAGCWPRSRARWPTRRSRSSSREAERDVEIRSGSSSFHLRVLPAEDFPKLPAPGRRAGLKIPAAALGAEHRAGRPRRLARRHAPGPDRRLRRRLRHGDDDGRDRLLPARGQADRARERARRRDRRQHPGPGAARAGPHPLRRGGRGGDGLAAPQPGRFPGRVDHPHHAADRGPVPQLSTAPAGVLRARRATAARRLPRRHPPGQPAGPAQRAAAALLRAGRADGRRRDARRRRRRGDDAGRLRGRAAGDRLQPRVPQGGDRKRRGRGGAAAADLAAAARACCSRSRAKTSATW